MVLFFSDMMAFFWRRLYDEHAARLKRSGFQFNQRSFKGYFICKSQFNSCLCHVAFIMLTFNADRPSFSTSQHRSSIEHPLDHKITRAQMISPATSQGSLQLASSFCSVIKRMTTGSLLSVTDKKDPQQAASK